MDTVGKWALYILAGITVLGMYIAFSTLARAHEHVLVNGDVVNYSNWVNKNGHGCCNNEDCLPIPEGFERTREGVLEVFVEGRGVAKGKSEWCPVMAHHYLSKGNAPNGSVSHYCVWHHAGNTPCLQFICYQPQAMY